MFLRNVCYALLVSLVAIGSANAAPAFSKGTSIKGAIAYQDATDPSQFWYLPTAADELLGERLRAYRAIHFGFGAPYYVQDDAGNFRTASGGIVSGTFAYDLGDATRTELIAAIKKAFKIENPKLLPLPLRSPEITSVLLAGVFGQFGKVEQQLPSGFQIGPEVAFSAGSATSLFAAVIANAQVGEGIQANPTFSLNVNAKAEFVGDPWTYDVDCDLAQVWKQVRKSGSAAVSYGWFRIGSAQYQGLWQDLQKSNVCTFNQVEGSLDTATYGRQIGELMKTIFQAINDSAVNGTGFFRFEPNPEAPPVSSGGGGFSLFGWSFSVNAGYSKSFFSQSIKFHRTISYTGRLEAPVTFSAVMAVACGPETKQYFADLGNTAEPCITQSKIDAFMERAKREAHAKTARLIKLTDDLANGKITETQYEKILALYGTIDFTDTLVVANTPASIFGSLNIAQSGQGRAFTFVSDLSDAQIDSVTRQAIEGPTLQNLPSEGVTILQR